MAENENAPAAKEGEGLKSCPFCGGEADVEEYTDETSNPYSHDDATYYRPCCKDGDCPGVGAATAGEDREEAIAAWNRRQPAVSGEGERAYELARDIAERVWQRVSRVGTPALRDAVKYTHSNLCLLVADEVIAAILAGKDAK